MEQLGQIQWNYSDPTRRIRSNVCLCDMPLSAPQLKVPQTTTQ